jgi:hypothetical protein
MIAVSSPTIIGALVGSRQLLQFVSDHLGRERMKENLRWFVSDHLGERMKENLRWFVSDHLEREDERKFEMVRQ